MKKGQHIEPTVAMLAAARNRRKLAGDLRDAVIQAYADGESMREIRRRFGAGQWSVYTALRDSGVPRRPRGYQPRALSEETKSKMVSLRLEDGWSQDKIAAHFHCHQRTVGSVLASRGLATCRRGGEHHGWKGGVHVNKQGYRMVLLDPSHLFAPMRNSVGYVSEHRLVVAQKLGRPLSSSESVHHINGDKLDNSPENLQLRQGQHGVGVVMRCRCCGSSDIEVQEIKESQSLWNPTPANSVASRSSSRRMGQYFAPVDTQERSSLQ